MRPRIVYGALVLAAVAGVWTSSSLAAPATSCFTEVATGLPGIGYSSVAWGDYDNDGDQDILLAGNTNGGTITRVYRNSGGPNPTFSDILTGLPGSSEGEVAWADFDSDGDLDITITGWGGPGRLTKIYRNNGGPNPLFTDTLIELPGIVHSALAWGDYDNDGDLDLLLTGQTDDFSGAYTSRIYRNSSGPNPTFIDIGAGLEGVRHGSVAWGDFDNDGDLDILMCGDGDGMPVVPMVYVNSGGPNPTFTGDHGNTEGVNASVAWGDYESDGDLDVAISGTTIWTNVQQQTSFFFTDNHPTYVGGEDGTISWGDFDNDGYLDLLVVGYEFFSGNGLATLHRNSGQAPNYLFSVFDAALPGVGNNYTQSAAAWGDYDGDGDLDILLTGRLNTGSDATGLYRNDCGPANAPPQPPTNLSATQNGSRVTFHWNAVTDDHTPSTGLHYNLRVGTSPGACDIVSPMANATSGYRHLPALGNAQKRTSWEIELPGADPFYWSVQAIDGALAGSPFAAEESTSPTAVEEGPVATTTALWSAGPNPFSRTTTARFSLAQHGRVSLAVFDVTGRRVRSLADGDLPAGTFHESWDGRDDAGRVLPAGVYLVRLTAASREQSFKILLAH